MRAFIKLLGAILILAIAAAAVEILHPKGVTGLVDEVLRRPSSQPARTGTPAAVVPVPAAQPPKPVAETWGPGAARELSWADRDADRGDFDGAISNYTTARVAAADAAERQRATQGLEKALLAAALVRGAQRVPGKPADLEAEYQKRLAAVEGRSDERAWVELARWTAGAGLRERLPHVCSQTLDAARPGGAVQAMLDEALAAAPGHRRDALQSAMAGRSLAKAPAPSPGAPLPSATPALPAASGVRVSPPPEASGIGGVNTKGVPFGNFTQATREKLREAIRWERDGTTAYDAAGPGSPNRADNRHTAMRLLRDARDAYLAAQAEDDDSKDLDDRLKHVLMLLAQLRKDEGVGK